jgi:hypothetical protein
LTPDPSPSAALDFILHVERLYASLIRHASSAGMEPGPTAEPALGGKLLYAGDLGPDGRATLVAGNIAGAASLAATADPGAGKQAIRDGAADFLVNSLDEALRILKNEIRKREAVAVCIAAAPEMVECEMLERGVVPDLTSHIELVPETSGQVLLTWRVDSAPAQWLPKLYRIAVDCLESHAGEGADAAVRWLRLAPRYLGRLAQGVHIVRCNPETANDFIQAAQNAVNRGEIAVQVRIAMKESLNGSEDSFVLQPPR